VGSPLSLRLCWTQWLAFRPHSDELQQSGINYWNTTLCCRLLQSWVDSVLWACSVGPRSLNLWKVISGQGVSGRTVCGLTSKI
jgi:hypothetical protein